MSLIFTLSKIETNFRFENNRLQGFVDFEGVTFPEQGVIEWASVRENLAVAMEKAVRFNYKTIDVRYFSGKPYFPNDSIWVSRFYSGNEFDNPADRKAFDKLRAVYKTIRDTYSEKGKIEEGNDAFVATRNPRLR